MNVLATLVMFMAVDYVTGFAAAVFGRSRKSESGRLESHVGWKGLCQKGISLLVVLVACRLDLVAQTDFIGETVMIAYLVNELISIVENAGLIGVPIPGILVRAIRVLKKREEEKGELVEAEELDPAEKSAGICGVEAEELGVDGPEAPEAPEAFRCGTPDEPIDQKFDERKEREERNNEQ